MQETNEFFEKGKISILADSGSGSSGKGKIASFLCKHSDNWDFLCNTHSSQASHSIVDGGKTYVFKQLNAAAYFLNERDKNAKIYIGHGAVLDVPSFFKELEICNLNEKRVNISPVTPILQDIDRLFEEGKVDFDGNPVSSNHSGTISFGSTCSGVGATRARKVLRRPSILFARDIPALVPFINNNLPEEIMRRLNQGQAGLLEIAQGFQLSYGLPQFVPYCTSRNCSVSAGLDDMMLPPIYAGNVLLNLRTLPIRIHSHKYISKKELCEVIHGFRKTCANGTLAPTIEEYYIDSKGNKFSKEEIQQKYPSSHYITSGRFDPDDLGKEIIDIHHKAGRHLFWEEVQSNSVPYEKIDSPSGDWYDDQKELTWEEVTKLSGSPTPIMECTTLTRLPRRVATWSIKNLIDSVAYNRTSGKVFISVNFMNYIDHAVSGLVDQDSILSSEKCQEFIQKNIVKPLSYVYGKDKVFLRYVGTGAETDKTVIMSID